MILQKGCLNYLVAVTITIVSYPWLEASPFENPEQLLNECEKLFENCNKIVETINFQGCENYTEKIKEDFESIVQNYKELEKYRDDLRTKLLCVHQMVGKDEKNGIKAHINLFIAFLSLFTANVFAREDNAYIKKRSTGDISTVAAYLQFFGENVNEDLLLSSNNENDKILRYFKVIKNENKKVFDDVFIADRSLKYNTEFYDLTKIFEERLFDVEKGEKELYLVPESTPRNVVASTAINIFTENDNNVNICKLLRVQEPRMRVVWKPTMLIEDLTKR